MRKEGINIARSIKRISISMDVRLITACDKFLEKLNDSQISSITTKSQLIEQALLCYFATLEQNLKLEKGEEQSES